MVCPVPLRMKMKRKKYYKNMLIKAKQIRKKKLILMIFDLYVSFYIYFYKLFNNSIMFLILHVPLANYNFNKKYFFH